MSILFITGGFGFLGQYIVQAVHAHDPGAELRVLVSARPAKPMWTSSCWGVRWIHGDLLKPETYAEDLRGVDTVIHNAAMVSFRKGEGAADLRLERGGHAESGASRPARRLPAVHLHQLHLGGGPRPGSSRTRACTRTWRPSAARDAYGYSKVISEQELEQYAGSMRVIILNPSVVMGPGSDRVELAAKALRLLPALPMLTYTNSFVDVRETARAVVLALTRGRSGERYIVTAWNIGMLEFTRTALAVMENGRSSSRSRAGASGSWTPSCGSWTC